jgi:hypothetical protein
MPVLVTFAADVGDADSTRTIWAIIALLVMMGLALVMVAFWVRRSTRPDPEFLAPLELMDERSWRKGDSVWQRRRLDEVRTSDARPLERAAAPPRFDESFDDGPSGSGFDDLHADAVEPAVEHAVDRAGDGTDDERDSGTDADGAEPADDDGDATTSDDARSSDDRSSDARSSDDRSDAGADGGTDDLTPTPIESTRPPLDQLPNGDFDPSALQRALDELDAELGAERNDR